MTNHTEDNLLQVLTGDREALKEKLAKGIVLVMGTLWIGLFALVFINGGAAVLSEPFTLFALVACLTLGTAAITMVYFDRAFLGLALILGGANAPLGAAQLLMQFDPVTGSALGPASGVEGVFFMLAMAGLLLKERHFIGVAVTCIFPVALSAYSRTTAMNVDVPMVLGLHIYNLALLFVMAAGFWFSNARSNQESEVISQHLDELGEATRAVERISQGDLAPIPLKESDFGRVVGALRLSLRSLIGEVHRAVREVGSAATQLEAMAAVQSSGVTEQAAAIAETRAAVSGVSSQAAGIGLSAAQADEAAHATSERFEELSERLDELLIETHGIAAQLKEIRGISDRSDLLALNASLEGVRAGQAGRGFTLVAQQMQTLADRVRHIVGSVEEANTRVAETSDRTIRSMESSRAEAGATRSAAASIRQGAQAQDEATSQVSRSMDEIASVTHRLSTGGEELASSARQLSALVQQLDAAASRFTIQA